MPIRLTETLSSKLDAESTRPITLVRWEHSGVLELLSCSGTVVFNGENYAPGGANIIDLQDGRSATLKTPATSARIQEIINGTWRNGICQIYAVPSLPDIVAEYTSADGVLCLDGYLVSSVMDGDSITVSVLHKFARGLTPRNTIGEIAKNIPAPGTILTYGTDQIVLEARR